MEKNRKFLANRKGMYRVAFTICILFLSGLVVTVTENNQSTQAPVSVADEPQETEVATDVEITKIIDGLTARAENPEIISADKTETPANDISHDQSFSTPIYGKVQKPFSIDAPIYSKTMDDWRIHQGVDISSAYGTEVYFAQDGVVSDIGHDINLGSYISVKNGPFELKYASVAAGVVFNIGDNVYKGQLIGTVDDSCISEICDEPHLHFEIKKDGKHVDPTELIFFE